MKNGAPPVLDVTVTFDPSGPTPEDQFTVDPDPVVVQAAAGERVDIRWTLKTEHDPGLQDASFDTRKGIEFVDDPTGVFERRSVTATEWIERDTVTVAATYKYLVNVIYQGSAYASPDPEVDNQPIGG